MEWLRRTSIYIVYNNGSYLLRIFLCGTLAPRSIKIEVENLVTMVRIRVHHLLLLRLELSILRKCQAYGAEKYAMKNSSFRVHLYSWAVNLIYH